MRVIRFASVLVIALLLLQRIPGLATEGDYARDGSSPLPVLPSDAELRALYPEFDPLPTGDRLLDLYGEARLSAFRAEAWLGEKECDELKVVSGWYEFARNHVDFVKPPQLNVMYSDLPAAYREKWWHADIDYGPGHYLSAGQIEALEPEFGGDPRYWQLRAFGFGQNHTNTYDFNEHAYRTIIEAFRRGLADEDLLYELRTLFAYASPEFVSKRLREYDPSPFAESEDPEALQREHELAVSLLAELGLDEEGLYTAMIARNPQRQQSYFARAIYRIKHDRNEDALADIRQAVLASDYRDFNIFPDNAVLELLRSGAAVNPVEFEWGSRTQSVVPDLWLAIDNLCSDTLQSELSIEEKVSRIDELHSLFLSQALHSDPPDDFALRISMSVLGSIPMMMTSGEQALVDAASQQQSRIAGFYEAIIKAVERPSLVELLKAEPALGQVGNAEQPYWSHPPMVGRPGVERRVVEDTITLDFVRQGLALRAPLDAAEIQQLRHFDLTSIPLSHDSVIDMTEHGYVYMDSW